MTQHLLDFGRGDRIERAYSKLVRVLGDAVDAIGLIQSAGACDCAKSDLVSALAQRDHRHLRVEWLMAILDVAPPDFKMRIVSALLDWQGLKVEPLRELKPEEKLARLEQRIIIANRFGVAGLELVEENRR